jgi:hypothetical protein
MLLKCARSFFLLSISSQTFAFQCYLTLVKDSCWTNYEVKVVVLNSLNNEVLTTVMVPKGKSWTRQPFDCEPAMRLMYQASFQPVFWKSEENKTYWAIRYWSLPETIGPKESAWDIPVCYPSAFSAVPFPPDAIGSCKCDLFSIPPVPPSMPK